MTAPGADLVSAGTGIGEDPHHALPIEEPGRQHHCLVGGHVECPGHGTDGVSSGEA